MAVLRQRRSTSPRLGLRRRGARRDVRREGFTLLEVMVALGVLGFGLLALAAMQIHALQLSSNGRATTGASLVGRNQLEQLRRQPWALTGPTGGWTPIVNVTETAQAPTDREVQVYGVRWRISDLVVDRSRSIDVEVSWQERAGRNRTWTISTTRLNEEAL